MLKKLFSHSLIYGLAPQIPRIASLFVLPLITPFLTADDYGIFGIVTAYTTLLATVNSLGLNVVLSNSFYKHPYHIKKVWGQIYGFLYLWNIIFSVIVYVILYQVIPDTVGDNKQTILLLNVIPIIFFSQTRTIAQYYYQLSKKPMQIGIRTAVIGTIAIGLNYYLIAVMKMGYMGFFWSNFISSNLYNISYWIPLNYIEKIKPIFLFKRRFIKNALKISLPLVPHGLGAYLITTSDRVVMDRLDVGETEIGQYSFANNFSNLFVAAASATNTAISPYMLENYKKNEDEKNKYLIFIWMTAFLSFSFIACLWLREIFDLLVHNDQLKLLYPIAIILIMAICYRPMYVASIQKLFYEEKTNVVFKVTLTAGLVNILLNLIFIPIYGYLAAVVSTYITFILQGYIFYTFRVYKEISRVDYRPLFWMLTQIAATVIVFLLRDVNLLYKSALSLVIVVISFLYISGLNKKLSTK